MFLADARLRRLPAARSRQCTAMRDCALPAGAAKTAGETLLLSLPSRHNISLLTEEETKQPNSLHMQYIAAARKQTLAEENHEQSFG